MNKQDIHFTDWKRIFIGDNPALFLVDIFLRTAIIYAILLLTARLLGKRMAGQLTRTELAVMLTLGGIVSVAMQMPDRGLLQGVGVLACALFFQRGLTLLDWKSPRVETWTQGRVGLLVKDGVLDLAGMRSLRMSREQVFAALRLRKIFNLGRVKRMYFEACGEFSVFTCENEPPGLSTLPPSDEALRQAQPRASESQRVCNASHRLAGVEELPFRLQQDAGIEQLDRGLAGQCHAGIAQARLRNTECAGKNSDCFIPPIPALHQVAESRNQLPPLPHRRIGHIGVLAGESQHVGEQHLQPAMQRQVMARG